ncbi:MAG TPA: SMP-30/gluconolactonase/LRE family protein [Chitinophagaceae bacterium]|nr:SMP-30/gluconolactonase/LRE family protein [Chitinophagaceae bacterium]
MIRIYAFWKIYVLLLAALIALLVAGAQETRQLAVGKPSAIADLRTNEGAALLSAKWYVQTAQIADRNFQLPGPQKGAGDALPLYPTGAAIQTHRLDPQVGDDGFEKGFVQVNPTQLEDRQGTGLFSFVWYRIELTIPAAIGNLQTAGTSAVFEIVVDDYSEIWVNGKQALGFGQNGNGLISGYNTRNRVLLTNNAKAGDQFTIHVLGINGPLGKLPENYIWVRNAVVDFYKEGLPVNPAWKDIGRIYTIDKKLDEIINPGTRVEKVADGFSFTEGPVWHPDGYLLFSDPNTNTIYRYNPANHNVTVYMSHSGYTGADIGEYGQPGSNGLAIDKEGRLIVAQHGNRRIIRHEKKGPVTILSDKHDGKRLNSPNDVVLKSDGTVYFTDPPYGLPNFYKDARKETPHQGVYLIRNGKTQLISTDLGGPNGIAFSPDEKYLYVTNWDIRDIHHTKTLWRYEVQPDGSLKNGKIFFDWNLTEDEEALDGMKVDKLGNLYVSAPGGLWILSPDGKLLGKIVTPERPANMAWGDDGKTLYMTAHSSLYKIRVNTGGKFSWE